MSWTQANLDEIEAAIATGALEVKFSQPGGEKTVKYRSLDEMYRIRDSIKKCLGLFDKKKLRKYTAFSKGL